MNDANGSSNTSINEIKKKKKKITKYVLEFFKKYFTIKKELMLKVIQAKPIARGTPPGRIGERMFVYE